MKKEMKCLAGFPAHMANYVIGGVKDNISKKDVKEYEEWRKENEEIETIMGFGPQGYFSWHPLFGLPCECYDLVYLERNKR